MSMDKVALSSSVEVPESTPVVIRRNSDDDKRTAIGTTKRSSNPFVTFPSTEELPDEPSYVIPRRHSDDDKRTIDRSKNPFEVIFKTSDFGRKTKVQLKSDFLLRQDSEHILGVPRRDSGYGENDVNQVSEKSSNREAQEASRRIDGRGKDQSSQTTGGRSDFAQIKRTNGQALEPQDNGTEETMSKKALMQPHSILRRGSGPDQTTDGARRNSGPKNNDIVDFNIPSDAPRRPSVHFADMPRRNSDPKHKGKEQFPDTLRRSSEPEQGYLEQRKTWEQFPDTTRRSSDPIQEYIGVRCVFQESSDPSQSFECQEVFPEPACQSVGIQVQQPFPDSSVVDSGVQTPDQKNAFLESVGVQADLSRRGSQENRDHSAGPAQSDSNVGISASAPKKSAAAVDERLAQRRRSLVPMSSMEEESLRERLHMAHLRCCSEIVLREQRYSRETFRKLFQNKIPFFSTLVNYMALDPTEPQVWEGLNVLKTGEPS
ncbi:unnamed protein product [Callosobruchus maculatus]|uniref:Uncharacterized protein n=1 Tax=Callosobruchus maculatus TaxID=64391 RepID=A0A653CV38_CALMS|nr:unnamed protein product [Callosobruchus maculatus]